MKITTIKCDMCNNATTAPNSLSGLLWMKVVTVGRESRHFCSYRCIHEWLFLQEDPGKPHGYTPYGHSTPKYIFTSNHPIGTEERAWMKEYFETIRTRLTESGLVRTSVTHNGITYTLEKLG